MCTYAIQYYVAFVVIWPAITSSWGPFSRPLFTEMVIRIVIVLITCNLICAFLYSKLISFSFPVILAELIPILQSLISLVGAFSSSTLALLLPPILEFVLRWKMATITPCVIIKDVIIFAIGMTGLVAGTYITVLEIIKHYSTEVTARAVTCGAT